MLNDNPNNIFKVNSIVEEIEASFNFINEGIRDLNNKSYAIANNHVALQLLSSGFERLVKILLLLKEKEEKGKYPELPKKDNYFYQYNNGHGIDKMIDELIIYSETQELMKRIPIVVDDIGYLKSDKKFKEFVNIITDFSIRGRYYYIDRICQANFDETKQNPFNQFKSFIYSFTEGLDINNMTYEEETAQIKKLSIITIEKGVRALSRFFTHGLGENGRRYYGDFTKFLFLNDSDFGKLNFLKPKIDIDKSRKPINILSIRFFYILLFSKSKKVYSYKYNDWPFIVKSVRVLKHKNNCTLLAIGLKVYSINGWASTYYGIPNYLSSSKVKPKQYASFLSDIVSKL